MPRWSYMVVIAAGLAVFVLLYGRSSSAGTGPATIRITSRQISNVRVDVGRRGRSPGDTEIVRQNLFNKRIKSRPIGHADFVCTYTTSQTRTCTGTIFLPRGRIVVGGSIRFPELYELSILGGTRLYDNARGTLTVIRTTRRPTRNILLFRLTG
jgi:hypothetical protein